MTRTPRQCVAMSLGAALLAVVLSMAGVPDALLLVLVPTLMYVAGDHATRRSAHGEGAGWSGVRSLSIMRTYSLESSSSTR